MSKKQATPIRRCVGCGERDLQSRLLRFALGAEGALVPGPGNGRGGYLHPRQKCIQTFATSRTGFIRSLRTVVSREKRHHYITVIEQSATLLP